MAQEDEFAIEYEKVIKNIPLSQIASNKFNPRQKFVESEEDELIESIIEKGVLNPIIVYKKKKDRKYVILDGERRYRACKKINYKTIPAHILVREPNRLENLSMMFHLHNVREEWTDFAIALSLQNVVLEMGKSIFNLKTNDFREISKVTSMSDYKIRKYLGILQYPKEVINRFLKSEMKEKPDKGYDPDILAEMQRPIKQIRAIMPEFLEKYSVAQIIDACVKKKARNIINNNREFRLLSKALNATKKGKVRKKLMKEKFTQFIEDIAISPENIYADTSEAIYLLQETIKKSEKLYEILLNINLSDLTKEEKMDLAQILNKLVDIIEEKIK